MCRAGNRELRENSQTAVAKKMLYKVHSLLLFRDACCHLSVTHAEWRNKLRGVCSAACMVVVHRGFMVQKGPGTIWESWTDSTNSHNHPALSADIGVFLYTLAGVQPSTWGKHGTDRVITFSLDPKTSYLVNAASVYVGSTGGRAAFSWSFHQHDHHQHHPGDHNRSLLDDHRTAATALIVGCR